MCWIKSPGEGAPSQLINLATFQFKSTIFFMRLTAIRRQEKASTMAVQSSSKYLTFGEMGNSIPSMDAR
jgi:hypothetical protein